MEQEEKKNRSKLLLYYTQLLSARGSNLDEKQSKALDSIVDRFTEAEAERTLKNFDENRLNRLLAYSNAFHALTKSDEEEADALLEVVNAVKDDPEEEIFMINGNKFRFEKGSINIEKHKDTLFEIGERTKGNTWFIYENDNGELVIY